MLWRVVCKKSGGIEIEVLHMGRNVLYMGGRAVLYYKDSVYYNSGGGSFKELNQRVEVGGIKEFN